MNELTTETLKNLITAAQSAGMEEIVVMKTEGGFSDQLTAYAESIIEDESVIRMIPQYGPPTHIASFMIMYGFRFTIISL